jgi:hypothetical protein
LGFRAVRTGRGAGWPETPPRTRTAFDATSAHKISELAAAGGKALVRAARAPDQRPVNIPRNPGPESPLEPPVQVGADGITPTPRRVGRPWIDMFLALSAILISSVSLYVAFVQGDVSRRMLAASSWPLLQYESGNISDDGRPAITMAIVNQGVGTAVVDEFKVFYRGKEERTAYDLLADCCGYHLETVDPISHDKGSPRTNFIQHAVIRSGESKFYLAMDLSDANKDAWRRLDRARFQIKLEGCYCSVLGDCWRTDLVATHPTPVKACAPPKAR